MNPNADREGGLEPEFRPYFSDEPLPPNAEMRGHRFHGVPLRNGRRCGMCSCGWTGEGDKSPLDEWDDHRFLESRKSEP